jgi:hypothetical protein
MSKKIIVYALAALLVNLVCVSSGAMASPSISKEQDQVEKLKAGIIKLGTGPDAQIKIRLRDKTKISGYVSEAGERSFVVVDAKTGQPTSIPYPQVGQAKGNNLSSKAKIAITLIVLTGVFILVGLSAKN